MLHKRKYLGALLCVASALVLSVTSCSTETCCASRLDQPAVMTQSNSAVVGEISFYTGGAISKKLKKNKNYRPLRISFVSGDSPAIHQSKISQKDEFIVGVDSATGKAALQAIERERPWNWEGLKAIPFANGLYFDGSFGEKSWKRTSVYPDEKLEDFLKRMRELINPL